MLEIGVEGSEFSASMRGVRLLVAGNKSAFRIGIRWSAVRSAMLEASKTNSWFHRPNKLWLIGVAEKHAALLYHGPAPP